MVGKAARKQIALKTQMARFAEDFDFTTSEEEPEESPSESESSSESPEVDHDDDGFDQGDFDEDGFHPGSKGTPTAAPSTISNEDTPPSEELVHALEALSLHSLQMQRAGRLPFLVRSLRRGFEHRCRLAGVPIRKSYIPNSVNAIYKCNVDPATHVYQTRIAAWRCPLCELHGLFNTREMLAKHIEWDHSEVTCSWQKLDEVRFVQLHSHSYLSALVLLADMANCSHHSSGLG